MNPRTDSVEEAGEHFKVTDVEAFNRKQLYVGHHESTATAWTG